MTKSTKTLRVSSTTMGKHRTYMNVPSVEKVALCNHNNIDEEKYNEEDEFTEFAHFCEFCGNGLTHKS